jgi:hypothetical protein
LGCRNALRLPLGQLGIRSPRTESPRHRVYCERNIAGIWTHSDAPDSPDPWLCRWSARRSLSPSCSQPLRSDRPGPDNGRLRPNPTIEPTPLPRANSTSVDDESNSEEERTPPSTSRLALVAGTLSRSDTSPIPRATVRQVASPDSRRRPHRPVRSDPGGGRVVGTRRTARHVLEGMQWEPGRGVTERTGLGPKKS